MESKGKGNSEDVSSFENKIDRLVRDFEEKTGKSVLAIEINTYVTENRITVITT